MNHSASSSQQSLRIEQMLFGYDRGHTLLASSETSSKKLSASLLSDTDWDPRVGFDTDSYLSGRPIPGEKRYALMKTWRAPEMPRPGCVWTHVLLLDDADLSRISQLTSILTKLQKPEAVGEYRTFSKHLELDLSASQNDTLVISQDTIFQLALCTYSKVDNRSEPWLAEEAEVAMLALWSQQWPGLRRQFSFRLAPLNGKKSRTKSNFDIEFTPLRSHGSDHFEPPQTSIISKIANDAVELSPTRFRRFLWRYGADTSNKNDDLVKLAQLYELLFSGERDPRSTDHVLLSVSNWYPKPEEAGLLKREMMQPGAAEFSILPDLDQFEILQTIARIPNSNALPDPEPVARTTVQAWITTRPDELAVLLSKEASREGLFIQSLFDGVVPKENADFLWNLYEQSDVAFFRASNRSIDHLADSRVKTLSDEGLVSLLQNSKLSKPSLVKLVPFITDRSHSGLVKIVSDAVPETVTEILVDHVSTSSSIGEVWIEYVKGKPDWIIQHARKTVKKRSQLLACRYLLNADQRKVPNSVWAERLEKAKDDLSGTTALEFRVFLLVQALRDPSECSQILVRDAFDSVHEALSNRVLAWRTENYLAEYLPSIGWYSNWDKCLRLKMAIVALWKEMGLSKRTLQEATRSERLKAELISLW